MLRRWSAGLILLVWGMGIYVGDQPTAASAAAGKAGAVAVPPTQSAEKKPKNTLVYVNDRYGFKFFLPKTWKGYTVISGRWQGGNPNQQDSENAKVEEGPTVWIRNPHWTEEKPWQDIPIMVFTLEQWKLVEDDELIVSAAPFGPGEIGRNCRYVFALPPRYNYADAEGVEEVNQLMQTQPLHAY